MFYKGFDIRANMCNKVCHKRYQFEVNGSVVYESDDALLYDAISGYESDFTEEDYERAEPTCKMLIEKLVEQLDEEASFRCPLCGEITREYRNTGYCYSCYEEGLL